MSLVAGVARVPLPMPLGGAMMGYGARTGTAATCLACSPTCST